MRFDALGASLNVTVAPPLETASVVVGCWIPSTNATTSPLCSTVPAKLKTVLTPVLVYLILDKVEKAVGMGSLTYPKVFHYIMKKFIGEKDGIKRT